MTLESLDDINMIKLKGTINEGFVGDGLEGRSLAANGHLGLANGHVTTTTQSDYNMNYEHTSSRREEMMLGGGDLSADSETPMIIAELEPRDSDSGIRSTSGMHMHGRSQHMTQNFHSRP